MRPARNVPAENRPPAGSLDGKTVLTMRQLHPTVAQRDRTIGFRAVEYGYQTPDKLAAHLEGAL